MIRRDLFREKKYKNKNTTNSFYFYELLIVFNISLIVNIVLIFPLMYRHYTVCIVYNISLRIHST